MNRENVLKNICLEYVEDDFIEITGDQIFVLVPVKYVKDLKLKMERRGCIFNYVKKKHFLMFLAFSMP